MALTHQKVLFGFLVMVTLTLQGCGMTPAKTTTTTTGEVSTQTTGSMTDHDMMSGSAHDMDMSGANTAADTTAQAKLNGTFALSGTYNSPAGLELMNATVVLENDIITKVSAQNVAKSPISMKLQDKFISGIEGQIVGKNIADVNVTHVNGSSLTAVAFNKALHDLQK